MGKYLGQKSPPVFQKFTTEQVQNTDKLVKYLGKVCCHPRNSQETEITAVYWHLAHDYQGLLITVQRAQGQVSGPTDRPVGTMATQTPRATMAAAPETQPGPVSVTSVQKKKHTRKVVCLAKDKDESRSSQEQEEEPEVFTPSLFWP